ncbi:MAG: alpha/beta fold hydrolase [Micromonosporaceae bacterium]
MFSELLAYWGVEEPLVVAHDFGGAVSLRAHLLHGAAYRALALVDPVALAPWGSPFFRLVGLRSEVFEAHELAARIPGARLELIAGAGHLVQEDAPAELTGALINFLRQQGPAA